MTERADQLAGQLDAELARMAGFVSTLTPEQVAAPCRDPQGDTVSGVLTHLREGTEQVVEWAARVSGAGASPAPAAHAPESASHSHEHAHEQGHAHGHGPHSHGEPHAHGDLQQAVGPAQAQAEVTDTVAMLRDGGAIVVGAVRGLSDQQLDVVPPATPGLADGVMTLHQIIEFIVDDLAGHRAHLDHAVAQVATVAR